MKFLIVNEPSTDVIEIEAKKARTINEKTFPPPVPLTEGEKGGGGKSGADAELLPLLKSFQMAYALNEGILL